MFCLSKWFVCSYWEFWYPWPWWKEEKKLNTFRASNFSDSCVTLVLVLLPVPPKQSKLNESHRQSGMLQRSCIRLGIDIAKAQYINAEKQVKMHENSKKGLGNMTSMANYLLQYKFLIIRDYRKNSIHRCSESINEVKLSDSPEENHRYHFF